MNNVFSLGGTGPTERGTVRALSLVRDLDFRVGLSCWQKNRQGEDLFQSSRISSLPSFAVRLHPLRAPPDDFCKASSDAKHRFTYRSHRTRTPPTPHVSLAVAVQTLCVCCGFGEELVSKQRDPHIMAPGGNQA